MVTHLLLSAATMAIGLAVLAFVYLRYGEGRTTLRRFGVGSIVLIGIIAGVSAGSETYRRRCPDDPQEWCEYNDSVGAMAVIAVVFVIAACVRGWMLYSER